ncbi:MAG: phosphoadenosine phosphosulfate reductase family protein [Gammaproteobacteria bacterium]
MTAQACRREEPRGPVPHTEFHAGGSLTPGAIIQWALARAANPVVSTNFRPRTAVLLHMLSSTRPGIPVIWVDSGYNTDATYRFVERLSTLLALNLHVYTPRVTVARRRALHGDLPPLDTPAHAAFTREVKLEPFERAFRELQPDVWFTGIRADQGEFRRSLGVASKGVQGSLKVAPLYHWTDVDLENYLYEHALPDNPEYLDPTKGREDRECGLQFLGSGI